MPYELLLYLAAAIITIWAQINVQTTYSKYSKVRTHNGMTGAEAARKILDRNGLHNVRIEPIRGNLNDHYDPKQNVIRLSEAVYNVPSAAAVGVAAHEAGHAVQHSEKYLGIKIREAVIPISRIGSGLSFPLLIVGLFGYTPFLWAGIVALCLAVIFQIATLPVEFDASSRAMEALESTAALDESGLRAARKVLSAAALTYVAALASSLLQILRFLSIANRRR